MKTDLELYNESKFTNIDAEKAAKTLTDKGIQQDLNSRYGKDRFPNQNKALDSMHIDSRVAKSIYNFLTGKENTLPTIDTIVNLYNNSKHSLLSMGYGVMFSKLLEITCSTPVTNKGERIDRFSPKGYESFYSLSFKQIDNNLEPMFDKKRIEVLLDYIKQISERIPQKEDNEEVSLK